MRKIILFYVLLLILQALHVVEEILGEAYFINSFYNGLSNFIIVNLILLIVPTILLYFVIKKKKVATYLAFLYHAIMIIDGLDHIIEFYLNGVAGLITGILFLPVSVFLIIKLKQALPRTKK